MQGNIATFEAQIGAVCEAARDQVFDYFLLAIDRNALAGKFEEGNAVPHAVEPEVNSAMAKSFAVEAFRDTGLAKQINAGVLQHAGANPFFAVGAGPRFEHDGTDAIEMQQVRQHE